MSSLSTVEVFLQLWPLPTPISSYPPDQTCSKCIVFHTLPCIHKILFSTLYQEQHVDQSPLEPVVPRCTATPLSWLHFINALALLNSKVCSLAVEFGCYKSRWEWFQPESRWCQRCSVNWFVVHEVPEFVQCLWSSCSIQLQKKQIYRSCYFILSTTRSRESS